MHFPYADELKQIFSVTAFFYNIAAGNQLFLLRNRLEIKRNTEPVSIPDAIVIMMNPGSSRPLAKHFTIPVFQYHDVLREDWITRQVLIPTQPDNAQYQIMRLMELQKWNHVRVLNLSDIRAGNAESLLAVHTAVSAALPEFPHSLFLPERAAECIHLLHENPVCPILPSWGSSILGYLENQVLSLLPAKRLVHLTAEDGTPHYRYPSPYMKPLKLDWLEKMHAALNSY